MGGPERADHVLPASAGQMHVEQHDVGQALGDAVDRGRDVIRLADHIHLGAELGPDPGPEEPVVVHDEDPRPAAARGRRPGHGHGRPGCRLPAERGIISDTSVPSPRTL
jgi:hypothetical protein